MSLSTADVSVIIPCLNAEATLAEAIESALGQTAPPREILVIDDHSTDRSVAVAKPFGPIVRILSNPGHGTGPARRLGVLEARGKYVAFVDADDVLDGVKHERQLEILERNDPHTHVHTGATLFYDEPGRPSSPRASAAEATGRCTRVIFEKNPICGASTMLARSTILHLGNYDPDLWGTDDFYMSLAASTCCELVYLPEPLYHIRCHRGQMSNRRLRMVYHHWLAQERFRLRFPAAFSTLPAESVRQYMIEPVLQAARQAYWRRDSDGYRRVLRLAHTLAPHDPQIQTLWRRRWCPLAALRFWDRLRDSVARRTEELAVTTGQACSTPAEPDGCRSGFVSPPESGAFPQLPARCTE